VVCRASRGSADVSSDGWRPNRTARSPATCWWRSPEERWRETPTGSFARPSTDLQRPSTGARGPRLPGAALVAQAVAEVAGRPLRDGCARMPGADGAVRCELSYVHAGLVGWTCHGDARQGSRTRALRRAGASGADRIPGCLCGAWTWCSGGYLGINSVICTRRARGGAGHASGGHLVFR